jgi:hypothetical protein
MPDQFIKTTKEIKNYVGQTYTKYMADLVEAVDDLTIKNSVAPADPDPANQQAVEVWLEDGDQGAPREGAALCKFLGRPLQCCIVAVHRGTGGTTQVT